MSEPVWRKSSFSVDNNCVEVAISTEHIRVRDSKNPDGPVLEFTAYEWDAFLAGVHNGDFQV